MGKDTGEWGGRGSVDRHEWEGRRRAGTVSGVGGERVGIDRGSGVGWARKGIDSGIGVGGESGDIQVEEWGGRGREWG